MNGPTGRRSGANRCFPTGSDEVYARAEREDENELFSDTRASDQIYRVGKVSLGYQTDRKPL